MHRVIKRLGGYPCCHRQWRDDGHCRFLHGYDRFVQIEWEGERDYRGWVVDFGALKELKDALERQYDHTTLIAPDDPELERFLEFDELGVLDLRVCDPTMEGMTLWVKDLVDVCTPTTTAKVVRIECWENEKNAAVWSLDD